jgi:hypothetical protein
MFVPLVRGHLPGELTQKHYVVEKEKTMSNHKTTITRGKPDRKIIGFVHLDGQVILGFKNGHLPQQTNCIIHPRTGLVYTNGSGVPETMLGYSEKNTIYEGDSITIQF